jgi:hemerythrin-like metal-binding protein
MESYLPPFLLIGVPSIDREHQDLLVLLVRLSHNPDAHMQSEPIAETLRRLGEQLGRHFRNEERLFGSCGMPRQDVLAHVKAHQKILAQYAQLNSDLMQGNEPALADIAQLVKEWIVDHLLEHDVKIPQYLAA